MAETFANLSDLTKEVWTQNRLEKQFYNKRRWLDQVERTNKYTIGRQAQVPLETSLPGGSSSRSMAGGTLNAADQLHVDRADYTLVQHWQQVSIQTGAIATAQGPGVHSTVDAVDNSIQSNLDAMRLEVNRQTVSNGDALIAETTGSATSAEVELDPAGYGYDAIVRGWLRPGLKVDIGTAANDDSVVADAVIQSVEEVAATPSITIDSSVTVTGDDFVSVADNRVNNTAVHETSGLRTIVGSGSSTIGTIAGGGFWAPAHVDTATTISSLDLCLTLQRKVQQKTGKVPTFVTTSIKQQSDLYAQYESQVRFPSDKNTEAGNVDGFKWNGLTVNADPDIPDRELYMLTLEDFICVTGAEFGKPTWASDFEGSGGRLRWAQGSTSFVDGLVYFMQLGVKRRNSHAAAIGLTG